LRTSPERIDAHPRRLQALQPLEPALGVAVGDEGGRERARVGAACATSGCDSGAEVAETAAIR
jgi:hypothetical protein